MANTDTYIKAFLDETTVRVTDTGFTMTFYAYARGKTGGTYSTNIDVTIDPLANDATNLSTIKSAIAAVVNTAGLGRTYAANNVSVWGQFN